MPNTSECLKLVNMTIFLVGSYALLNLCTHVGSAVDLSVVFLVCVACWMKQVLIVRQKYQIRTCQGQLSQLMLDVVDHRP